MVYRSDFMKEELKYVEDNLALLIAVISLIFSAIGLVISIASFFYSKNKDKIRAVLSVGFDYRILPNSTEGEKKYVLCLIYNVGLRDIYLRMPCVYFTTLSNPKKVLLVKSEIFQGNQHEYKIKPGRSESLIFENRFPEDKFKDLKSLVVEDQLGNKFISIIAGRYKVILYTLKNRSQKVKQAIQKVIRKLIRIISK